MHPEVRQMMRLMHDEYSGDAIWYIVTDVIHEAI